jgi:hypothetical protein
MQSMPRYAGVRAIVSGSRPEFYRVPSVTLDNTSCRRSTRVSNAVARFAISGSLAVK